LANGKSYELTDTHVDKDARERLKASACARFTTVLGPASDGFHENHGHVDLAERRSGYRLCQWAVRDAAEVIPLPRERACRSAAARTLTMHARFLNGTCDKEAA